MLFVSPLFSKFYSTSNGISYFAKIRCAILSHACSSDLSSVNRFIDVPVVQLSFVPSYLKFRYSPCTSAGANERCSCSRSRAIFGADIERTKWNPSGVRFPLIRERQNSRSSFQRAYSRSSRASFSSALKKSFFSRPLNWKVLKVVISHSINKKESNAGCSKSAFMHFFVSREKISIDFLPSSV